MRFFILLILFASVLCIISGCSGPQEPPSTGKTDIKKDPIQESDQKEGKNEIAAEKKKSVVVSHLAGRWYPEDKELLTAQIRGFLDKVSIPEMQDVIALIMPHAGYMYSGETAAYAMKVTGKKYRRIVILGPSHYVPLEDCVSIPDATHYQTPLGEVSLDLEFIEKLRKYPMVIHNPYVHQHEHSVDIEIPFVQYCHPGTPIVPIVVGLCRDEVVSALASILSSLLDEQTLVIVSSDFVHYGPRFGYEPFQKDIPNEIRKMNAQAVKFIAEKDVKGFRDYVNKTGATICGTNPIAILLAMLPKTSKATLLKEASSADVTGDFSNTVSYLSIAFSGKWSEKEGKNKIHTGMIPASEKFLLSGQEKEILLKLARKTLEFYIQHSKMPELSDLKIVLNENLNCIRAVFVTLKKGEDLRGCIGEIYPARPLYRSLMTNVIHAAFQDRRFPPVSKNELPALTISISVLTVPEEVASYQHIRIGSDGIILQKQNRRAIFLPEVATEQGWDLPTTLGQLCRKAGLPPDAWKEQTRFWIYQTIHFTEKEKNL